MPELLCAEPADKDQRVDVYLTKKLASLSRSQINRLIREGRVKVNGKTAKASHKIDLHDSISIEIPPPRPLGIQPEKVPFTVLYEDEDILVLSKPPGIVVHPAAGHNSGTLVHGLLNHCSDLSGIGGVLRPGIVHRLDKDTSGLMVVAKNDRAHQELARQFKAGEVYKKYVALVYGDFREKSGIIQAPIGRHPTQRKKMSVRSASGREAITIWQVIQSFNGLTFLELTLKTGRTHQIRVHLSSMQHPVVGDPVYGGKQKRADICNINVRNIIKSVSRQLLHARELGFVHPRTGRFMKFHSPMPPDMQEIIEALS